MCGIAGFIDPTRSLHNPASTILKMTDSLRHRGPDGSDHWTDGSTRITFIHTRLSIQDLSDAGKQPMHSPSGRYVITYNGEVYNAPQLRKELEQYQYSFRGHSDTEVILAAIEEYGLKTAISKFIGMFAFALWDKQTRRLYLVRDRLGIKPLYYGWQNGLFVFSSELKAIQSLPDFNGEICRKALGMFVRYNYVPTPYSIYKDIYKLESGHILVINPDDKPNKQVQPEQYWSLTSSYSNAASLEKGSIEDEINKVESLLLDSVSLRMLSDVPVGAFLSGGVDSSLTTALMQSLSTDPIKTFTIGYEEQNYDESSYARKIAQHLGTDHTELNLSPKDALDVIPILPRLYDEPFADPSQIPTYLVSKLAREKVTVCLSGDGGDELFCGYNRHLWVKDSWQKFGKLPMGFRKLSASVIETLSPASYDQIYGLAKHFLPEKYQFSAFGGKLHKWASILDATDPENIYRRLVSQWHDPSKIVVNYEDPTEYKSFYDKGTTIKDISQRLMYLDTKTYLPDDILTKVDRASMGVGLEARVPLIDHRVVEYAARLPLSLKHRDNQSKWILRQILYKYVPKQLIERPKMGFAIPLDEWFRSSLRDWCESLIDENRLRNEGFFHPEPIRKAWKEHLSGRRNWYFHLWSIFMFQSWLDQNH